MTTKNSDKKSTTSSLVDLLNGPLAPTIDKAMGMTSQSQTPQSQSSQPQSSQSQSSQSSLPRSSRSSQKAPSKKFRKSSSNSSKRKYNNKGYARYDDGESSIVKVSNTSYWIAASEPALAYWEKEGFTSLISMTRTHNGSFFWANTVAEDTFNEDEFNVRLKLGLVDESAYIFDDVKVEPISKSCILESIHLLPPEISYAISSQQLETRAPKDCKELAEKPSQSCTKLYLLDGILFFTEASTIVHNKLIDANCLMGYKVNCPGVLYDYLSSAVLRKSEHIYYRNGDTCYTSGMSLNFSIPDYLRGQTEESLTRSVHARSPIGAVLGIENGVEEFEVVSLNSMKDYKVQQILSRVEDIFILGQVIGIEGSTAPSEDLDLLYIPFSREEANTYWLHELKYLRPVADANCVQVIPENDLSYLDKDEMYNTCFFHIIESMYKAFSGEDSNADITPDITPAITPLQEVDMVTANDQNPDVTAITEQYSDVTSTKEYIYTCPTALYTEKDFIL